MTAAFLVDADIIAYASAAAVHSTQGDYLDLINAIDCRFETWTDIPDLEGRDTIACLSSGPHFRRFLWPSYKATRTQAKPPMLEDAKDYIRDSYYYAAMEGLEADDVMGILATAPGNENSIIVTIDKDLLQIPGSLCNPQTAKFHQITESDGHYMMCYQWLVGDSSDNYPGLPGIGPVKAKKFLASVRESWEAGKSGQTWEEFCHWRIREFFSEKGHSPSFCEAQRLCAKILQFTDFPHLPTIA